MMTLADFLTVFWVVSDKIRVARIQCSSILYLCANTTHDCGDGRMLILSVEVTELQVQDVRLRDCVP